MPKMGISISSRGRSSSGASSPETGSRPTRPSPTSPPTRSTSRSHPRRAGASRRSSPNPATPSRSVSRSRRSTRVRRPGSASGRVAGRAARPRGRDRPRATRQASGFFSPVVRRIADKHGIDLDPVEGTGIGGRVRKRDVLAHVESRTGNRQSKPAPVLHTESLPPGRRSARARRARHHRVDGERRSR